MICDPVVVHNRDMDNGTALAANQQADCELICHAYVAFGRRDLRDLFHLLSPNASMVLQLGPLWPDAFGREEILDCLAGIIKGTDGSAMAEPVEMWRSSAGQIVAIHLETARWRGQELNDRVIIHWHVDNHRITEINRLTPFMCAP